ncbi:MULTISPECIES: hypothetical protein [unclassified Thioalkalivibrio]|uniref:hypothetical protein n=1 Tax=unclassified Thioalkalivibrio TaxID=2621013 RepID=UPI0003726EF1|nr:MULTISPECIES: hypothetical protein [unclassified Thioalkalivibrio]
MKAETVEQVLQMRDYEDMACPEPVELSARVEVENEGVASSGERVFRFQLYDTTGSARAYGLRRDWDGHGLVNGQYRDVSLHTAVNPRGERVLVAHPLYGTRPCERDALELLPVHRAPCPEDLGRLVRLAEGLRVEAYRDFLCTVFGDPAFTLSFVMGRASGDCHHREPGGLLAHSLEVAEGVMSATDTMSLDLYSREAGILLALFHDVGKCAVPDAHRIPEKRHERLIEYYLQEPMATLRHRDRDAHDALWRVIDAYRSGDDYGAPMAALVRGLDQCSAHADVAERALRARRNGYWHRLCGGRPVWLSPSDPERPPGRLGRA